MSDDRDVPDDHEHIYGDTTDELICAELDTDPHHGDRDVPAQTDEGNPYPPCPECDGDGLCFACKGSGNLVGVLGDAGHTDTAELRVVADYNGYHGSGMSGRDRTRAAADEVEGLRVRLADAERLSEQRREKAAQWQQEREIAYDKLAAARREAEQLRTERETDIAVLTAARDHERQRAERAEAELAVAGQSALLAAADEIANVRYLTNGGLNGFSELIAWPGSKTVEDWLRARAVRVDPEREGEQL